MKKSEEFVAQERALGLRFALGDIDRDTFVRRHADLVFDRICSLFAERSQLLPYTDLIVRIVFPDSNLKVLPEGISGEIDSCLRDSINLDDFIEKLQRVRLEERELTARISFGILGSNGTPKPIFVEFISPETRLPIKGGYSKWFRLAKPEHSFVRIPLAYKTGEESEPIRFGAVEFPLPASVSDKLKVTLIPAHQPKRILVALETSDACYRSEALFEFDDTSHSYAPLEPEVLKPPTEKLRHLVNQCFACLSKIDSVNHPERYKEVKDNLRLACAVLSRSDEGAHVKAYQSLAENLRKAGPTAVGFFAYKAVEHVFEIRGDGEAEISTDYNRASELIGQLYEVARRGNLEEEKEIADNLYELAMKAIIVNAARLAAINQRLFTAAEIEEFHNVVFAQMGGMKLVEVPQWLPVIVTSPHRLSIWLSEFLDWVTEIPDEVEDKLRKAIQHLTTHDDQSLIRDAFWQVICHLQEIGAETKGFFAYKFLEELQRQERMADTAIIARATSLFDNLAFYQDQEQQKQTTQELAALAIEWVMKTMPGDYFMGEREKAKDVWPLLKQFFTDQSERSAPLLLRVTSPPDRWENAMTEFLASPFAAEIPREVREGLRSNTQEIRDVNEQVRREIVKGTERLERVLASFIPETQQEKQNAKLVLQESSNLFEIWYLLEPIEDERE